MAVWRTFPWSFSTNVDGWIMADDSFCNRLCSCACSPCGVWLAESQTVGEDSGDHRGDPCSDQISPWHGARYLHPMGAGTRSLRAGVRRDCGSKLTGGTVEDFPQDSVIQSVNSGSCGSDSFPLARVSSRRYVSAPCPPLLRRPRLLHPR